MTDKYLPRPGIERLRKCDAMRVMWRVWFALQLPPAAAVQTQHATLAGLSELAPWNCLASVFASCVLIFTHL